MRLRQTPMNLACRAALFAGGAATTAFTLGSAPVYAQGGQLEEVIVTSTYREENLQDIGVAVTAISGDELNDAQIFGPTELAFRVPGMAYAEFAPGQAIISMRGVSSADDGPSMDNSVVMFLDGMYVGSIASISQEMFDVERIEVLRGPQGTLFGRNAVGGVINVTTLKPSQETNIRAEVSAGNEGTLRYQGLVSGGLTENLSAKLVYNHREHDGYVDNIVMGIDQQDEDVTSYRGQLRWETDNMDWLLSADYMEDEREDMGRFPVFGNGGPTVDTWKAWGGGFRKVAAPAGTKAEGGGSEREASGVSLQGDIEFGSGTLTSITGFRNAETDWGMASVGVGIPVEIIDDITQDIDTFTQEFRWTSNLDGKFNYVAGLYYLDEDSERTEQYRLLIPGAVGGGVFVDPATQQWAGASDIGNEVSRQVNTTTSYAAYFQGDYDLTDAMTLTFGLRYTYDEKDTTTTGVNCGNAAGQANFPQYCAGVGGSLSVIPETFTVSAKDDWSDVSPKFTLTYNVNDDLMVYGTASWGFKSGGFGGGAGTPEQASRSIDPENVINYEVGLKGDFLDRTLRVNAAAFYMDYTDLQIVRFGPTADNPDFGQFSTENVGEAEIAGVEAEITWAPSENFRLFATYAYLDTAVDDFTINGIDPTAIPGNSDDLRQAPENKYSLGGVVDFPLAGGSMISLRADYYHTDEQINDYINQKTVIDAFDLLDARVSWTSASGNWQVALWGKNLTDEEWVSHSYTIGPGVIGVWGAPALYGVSVSYEL
ncbi:TonB-dependent receptor [Luminiphilus sp. nBUS_16]|uniref:TonB-dependent receptor n=1 Tax=Luminiphilus sp. nBUS_16 TaxID=3395315 RepID=UPI003EC1561D